MRAYSLCGAADLFSRRLTHRQAECSGVVTVRSPFSCRVQRCYGVGPQRLRVMAGSQSVTEESNLTGLSYSHTNGREPLSRTSVVGVLGGGQLGRMLAFDAARLGVKIKVLDPTPNCPASAAAEQVQGSFQDFDTVCRFAEGVDVLTVEIEHIDTAALQRVADGGLRVEPEPQTLRTIQDKYIQKAHFRANGIPVADFVEVPDEAALQQAIKNFGFPLMLKSKRNAYDGKGNAVATTAADVAGAVKSLGGFGHGLYAEKWVPFELELAVMVVRSANGEIKSFPVVQTIHKDNICHTTETPARVPAAVQEAAKKVAEAAVACMPGAGIFGVEMFLLPDQSLLLNEIAPRPHNSGHYTIEACATSQFENHLRSVLDLPLGDTSLICGAAIMLNILGEADGAQGLRLANEMMERAYKVPGCSVHWYGKEQVGKGRKIGHITITAPNSEECRRRLSIVSPAAAAAMHDATYKSGPSSSSQSAAPPSSSPRVSIIMGSDSDLNTMSGAAQVLEEFGIPCEITVVSAHRTPERMLEFARNAHKRGVQVIIAGAGGAAHLPGMVAALTPLPVIGVPVKPSGAYLDGMDALLSIVQMPKGVPVATVAIGNAANAGLLAVRILGAHTPALLEKMVEYQEGMRQMVMGKAEKLETKGWREYKL